jgi:predicted O-methyltransferase YrrM
VLQPYRILEIGTFTGYSALCLAEGLTLNGQLITIDRDVRLKKHVEPLFARAGYGPIGQIGEEQNDAQQEEEGQQIIYKQGDAMEQIAELDGAFDLVFIDADKRRYHEYLEAVLPKIRPGGLLLLDNVLWKGRVYEADPIDDKGRPDAIAAYLKAFNEALAQDERLESVMLALRDGLWVCRVQ